MDASLLYDMAMEGLRLLLLLSAPLLSAVLLTSILVGILTNYTKMSDPAIGAVARILAALGGLILVAPWLGHRLVVFAEKSWQVFQHVVR